MIELSKKGGKVNKTQYIWASERSDAFFITTIFYYIYSLHFLIGSGHIGAMLTDGQIIAGNETFKSPSGTDETGHAGNGYSRITLMSTDN